MSGDAGPAGVVPRLAERYLTAVPHARRLARNEVLEVVEQFLRACSNETQVVLYGYSNTICEGLARCASWLGLPVFLVEDLQYGVEGSVGEHLYAKRHLEAAGIAPILIPFDQIAPLATAESDFVRNAAGQSVPLSRGRRVVAMLGCEAVDVNGQILIPSRIRGAPSETAKFIEVFHQSAQTPRGPADVVVVSETYKVHADLSSAAAAESHAPLKTSRARRAFYLMGLPSLPSSLQVELVRLPFSGVHAFIDDAGIHMAADERDLSASYRLWRDRTVGRLHERAAPRELGECLAGAQVAIFDLNGVLVDDEAAHFAAFGDVLRAHSSSLTYDEYLRHCSGRTDREGIENLVHLKKLGGDPDVLLHAKRSAYARHCGDYQLQTFPGALELARRLHDNDVRCFLVTSSDEASAADFVASCGLEDVFPTGRLFMEVDSRERRSVYERIAAAARGDASACVVFDDTPDNLASARELGMTTVGVATTYSAGRLSADVVVSGPLNVPPGTS